MTDLRIISGNGTGLETELLPGPFLTVEEVRGIHVIDFSSFGNSLESSNCLEPSCDDVRMEYLRYIGVEIPQEWLELPYKLPKRERHAQIYSAFYVANKFQYIARLMEMDPSISDTTLQQELDFISNLILKDRLDRDGFRDKVTLSNGESCIREDLMRTSRVVDPNPNAHVSMEELLDIKALVLAALKR